MTILLSFLALTALVAVLSWYFTRAADDQSAAGYFLAGRGLSPLVIAGSLLLTNLSTEQLVGLNGGSYREGMIGMAWEVFAALAMVIMALYLLPKYLKKGIATVPEFLETRYDRPTRALTSCVFLLSITLVIMPFVLYSGALFMKDAFDVAEAFGVSDNQALWITIVAIGVVSGCYAVFGGLRAVAVSDTLCGVGLLIGGTALPILGLIKLGGGSFAEGVAVLMRDHPEKLNPVGGPQSTLPWPTLFTGVALLHMAYWGTNQFIVQRAFAAKSLGSAQKGLMLAASLKLLGPFYLVLPGVIAWHLSKGSLANPDESYAWLMKQIITEPLFIGFFCAVIFGAILSSLNSAINSASTLFCLDLYRGWINPVASDRKLVLTGKLFGTGLGIAVILLAPLVGQAGGLFNMMKVLSATFDIPLLSVVLAGMLSPRPTARGAKIVLGGGIAFFLSTGILMSQWFGIFDRDLTGLNIPEFHRVGIGFVLCMGVLLLSGGKRPAVERVVGDSTLAGTVDLTGWPLAKPVGITIVVLMAGVYALFVAASS